MLICRFCLEFVNGIFAQNVSILFWICSGAHTPACGRHRTHIGLSSGSQCTM